MKIDNSIFDEVTLQELQHIKDVVNKHLDKEIKKKEE